MGASVKAARRCIHRTDSTGVACVPFPRQIPEPSRASDSDDPSAAASWHEDGPSTSYSSLAPLCTALDELDQLREDAQCDQITADGAVE